MRIIFLFDTVEYTCQRDSKSQGQEVIYFQNEGFPELSLMPSMCLFSVTVKDDTICQIRYICQVNTIILTLTLLKIGSIFSSLSWTEAQPRTDRVIGTRWKYLQEDLATLGTTECAVATPANICTSPLILLRRSR